jgi:Family of unknown function (DUF5995)
MLKSSLMNSSNIVLPTTIDEVIAHLDSIVLACEASGSRAGYFPAMYNRVTRRVKERMLEGAFEDTERMERFDVIFANRYLTAYYAYTQNEPCSESWKITFDAAKKWSPMVIQHLLASMNAHICLDLGIAAAETETQNLPSLKNDFDLVNDILDSLIDEVEAELREIFHPLVTFDKLTGNVYWRVAHVAVVKARSDAWRVALAYAELQSDTERQAFIQARDQYVVQTGNSILWPSMFLKLMVGQLRVFEKGNVSSKVRVLNRRPAEPSLLS